MLTITLPEDDTKHWYPIKYLTGKYVSFIENYREMKSSSSSPFLLINNNEIKDTKKLTVSCCIGFCLAEPEWIA